MIEAIALNFTESGCTISVKTAAGDETFPYGFGTWEKGQTSLFNNPELFGLTPIVTSGAWTANDTFTMVVRLYETPFFQTLVCHFDGDELMIESQVNVAFESTKALLLTARAM
jgi:hypothetical protein